MPNKDFALGEVKCKLGTLCSKNRPNVKPKNVVCQIKDKCNRKTLNEKNRPSYTYYFNNKRPSF